MARRAHSAGGRCRLRPKCAGESVQRGAAERIGARSSPMSSASVAMTKIVVSAAPVKIREAEDGDLHGHAARRVDHYGRAQLAHRKRNTTQSTVFANVRQTKHTWSTRPTGARAVLK